MKKVNLQWSNLTLNSKNPFKIYHQANPETFFSSSEAKKNKNSQTPSQTKQDPSNLKSNNQKASTPFSSLENNPTPALSPKPQTNSKPLTPSWAQNPTKASPSPASANEANSEFRTNYSKSFESGTIITSAWKKTNTVSACQSCQSKHFKSAKSKEKNGETRRTRRNTWRTLKTARTTSF